VLNENDTSILNPSEIKNGVVEELSPREITTEIMDYDVVKELREAKNNPNPVKIDADKIIEEKFLAKRKPPKKDVKKTWKDKITIPQKNVCAYEVNNRPF